MFRPRIPAPQRVLQGPLSHEGQHKKGTQRLPWKKPTVIRARMYIIARSPASVMPISNAGNADCD